MKRWIHAAKSLKSMDPYELRQAGYEQVDSGYARNRDDLENIKRDLASKYAGVRVYRDQTDTPGLLMWSAYAPISDEEDTE